MRQPFVLVSATVVVLLPGASSEHSYFDACTCWDGVRRLPPGPSDIVDEDIEEEVNLAVSGAKCAVGSLDFLLACSETLQSYGHDFEASSIVQMSAVLLMYLDPCLAKYNAIEKSLRVSERLELLLRSRSIQTVQIQRYHPLLASSDAKRQQIEESERLVFKRRAPTNPWNQSVACLLAGFPPTDMKFWKLVRRTWVKHCSIAKIFFSLGPELMRPEYVSEDLVNLRDHFPEIATESVRWAKNMKGQKTLLIQVTWYMILYAAQHIDADWYCRLEMDSIFVVENLLRYIQKHRLHPDDQSYFLGRVYFFWMFDLGYFADVGFCLPRGALFRLAQVLSTAPMANVRGASFETGFWDECALVDDGFDDVPISFLGHIHPVQGLAVEFRKATTESCTYASRRCKACACRKQASSCMTGCCTPSRAVNSSKLKHRALKTSITFKKPTSLA